MKTLQEVFDTAATHLLTQKVRSGIKDSCRYRNGTLKCAVGVLIADEHYHEDLEENGSSSYIVMQAVERSGWPCTPEAENLYRALQGVHDGGDPSVWPQNLANVAATFNLDASCLNTESHG